VIGSMLAGGDSIDDVAVLRAGAASALFDGTRAPSTVGSWLRAHKWSNVRQLNAISRELLARLWAAGAGPQDLSGPLATDLDSTIVEVHGRAKQGAAFGYTKVRGYHPQLATCAQTGQVLMSRLRGGSAGAARGAASFLTETVSRVRNAGATGQLTVRADSAFYSKAVLAAAAKFDVRFSITARQDKRVRTAIDAIPDEAWQPIPYWLSTPEVSGADIAETTFTVFASDKRHARQVRLVVRRVRPTPGSQLALFTSWDYHAFVTDRDLPLPEVEADHRRHAVVEQTIAELKSAGLAHLPSGKFMGQRCLARPGRDGAQPRPGRRAARRTRPGTGDRSDTAAQGVHHARPARSQRTTTAPTTSGPLAMGRRDQHRARPDPCHSDALLNNHPDHDDQGPRRSRRTGDFHTSSSQRSQAHHSGRDAQAAAARSAVDPGLIRTVLVTCRLGGDQLAGQST
jgi:hypothetical protein